MKGLNNITLFALIIGMMILLSYCHQGESSVKEEYNSSGSNTQMSPICPCGGNYPNCLPCRK